MWSITHAGGNCMQVFSGHSESVTCGRFSPDGFSISILTLGKLIVTGSSDSTIIVWNPKTGQAIHKWDSSDIRFHQVGITSLDVSNDSALIVSGGTDGTVNLLHAGTGKIISGLGHHGAGLSVESISFSKGMSLVATSGVDGVVNVWDISNMKLRFSVNHDVLLIYVL